MATMRIPSVLAAFLLFLSFEYCTAAAGSSGATGDATRDSPAAVYVTFAAPCARPDTFQESLYYSVIDHLKNLQVPVATEPEGPVILVDAVSKDEKVAISLLCGRILPYEVVDICKKAEVVYADLSATRRASLPGEGKWVREMVTENFMRQFIMPVDARVILVERSDAEVEIGKVVEEFCRKYLR